MADERRIDVVRFAIGDELIAVPWGSREELLGWFRHLDSMNDVRTAIVGPGTSSPIHLTREQAGALLTVIEHESTQTPGGLDGLPEGIAELRHALVDAPRA